MRFSYDAFVLNNKKDALFYSGPFSLTDKAITLKVGEVYKVYGVGKTGNLSVSASVASKVSTSISGNEITITATAATAANTPTVLTVTDSGSSSTSTVSVTVVA